MSIVNFLGCNVTLPFSDDDSEDKILVGDCFTDAEMRKRARKHLSTKQVYEVFTDGYIGMWFNDNYKSDYPKNNSEAQESFLALCKLLDRYLEEGDYCELYTCWFGDEEEERNTELDQTINLHHFDIDDIQIYEKTLLLIKK